MTDVFELVEVGAGDVLDTVTFGSGGPSYATGVAEPMIASRLRLIPDREQAVASLEGWSNGYLATRRKP